MAEGLAFDLSQEPELVQRENYLAEARDALNDSEQVARYRLATATKLFWRAYMFQGSDWWPERRRAADRLLSELFAQGRSGKTIAELDDAAVQRLSGELAALIQEIERR